MNQASSAPARWAAVFEFQRRRDRFEINTFEFEIADHAISLALNPIRPVNKYFARNVWRDARSVVLRQRRRRIARHVQLDDAVANVPTASDMERALIWEENYSRLRKALATRNRHAVRCLDGWRDGEEEQETAAAIGISREYVKKLRRLIRDTAVEIFPDAGSIQ